MVSSMLTEQLKLLEELHKRGIIHRDMKPDNFLTSPNRKSFRIYLVDFGLSKRYVDKEGKHIPFKTGKELTGTARYASINNHYGYE